MKISDSLLFIVCFAISDSVKTLVDMDLPCLARFATFVLLILDVG